MGVLSVSRRDSSRGNWRSRLELDRSDVRQTRHNEPKAPNAKPITRQSARLLLGITPNLVSGAKAELRPWARLLGVCAEFHRSSHSLGPFRLGIFPITIRVRLVHIAAARAIYHCRDESEARVAATGVP